MTRVGGSTEPTRPQCGGWTTKPNGGPMLGTMQDRQLTLDHFFDRAERLFANKTITTNSPAGEQHQAVPRSTHLHREPRRG